MKKTSTGFSIGVNHVCRSRNNNHNCKRSNEIQ